MRTILILLTAIFALSVMAPVVHAQEDEEVKTKFYDFDDMLIDGEFKKPAGMYTSAREEAKFKRLLSLKKSFLSKIEETSKVDALQ